MPKRVLTGIKPTGKPHLGNYVGAIRPALRAAQGVDIESYLFIADYHAVTGLWDRDLLQELTYDVAATWLAFGLDPEKTVFYRQSDIPEIFEIQWILSCMASKGLMNRAHAYKAAVDRNREEGTRDDDYGVNTGLFMYPVLMAADILCVNADVVPVGKDQVQHVEIARDIAGRFNSTFRPVFKLPNFQLDKEPDVIHGLDGRKMSKSYDNTIPLFVESKKLRKLVNKIKTSTKEPEDPFPPDDCNLFSIYKHFADDDEKATMRAAYEKGIGWGDAKAQLFEKLDAILTEPRERYKDLMSRKTDIDEILLAGATRARKDCRELLDQLRDAMGIGSLK